MNSDELLHLADLNLAEYCREQARWLPPFKIEERAHALFVASGTRFPAGASNCVLPFQSATNASQLLDEAREYFKPLGRGFSIYAPSHLGPAIAEACEAMHWPKLMDSPGMVLTERVEAPRFPTGVEHRTVRSEADGQDFIAVCAEAYESIGLPNDVARKLLARPARWNQPYTHVEVAYEGGRPVAAAMLLFSHGIAGVYWVGTLSEARGRGHATRLMKSVSNRALDAGALCVILQATSFGEPVYRKLGYREFTRYPWFLATQ